MSQPVIDYSVARRNMVEGQVRTIGVTDFAILEAMLTVPREQFLPEQQRPVAYLDLEPAVTDTPPARKIMAPMMISRLLQAANIGPGRSMLIVGCATGYSVALAAHIGATVVATEADASLARRARETLQRLGFAKPIVVDAPPLNGCPDRGPFDVILLDGASEREPHALFDQLKPDGHLVGIFALSRPFRAVKVTRSPEGIGYRPLFDGSAPVLPGLEKIPGFEF